MSGMLLLLQQSLPATWRDTFQLLASGFTWVLGYSKIVLDFALSGGSVGEIVLKAVLIVLPCGVLDAAAGERSEEHTSEIQSLTNLVCRLLLEKKNNNKTSQRCKT